MRVYIWEGKGVLKNYRTGVIVLVAENLEDAWAKLRKGYISAYWEVKTGRKLYDVSTPEGLEYEIQSDTEEYGGEDTAEEGYPIQPKVFELNEMPIIAQWGSE